MPLEETVLDLADLAALGKLFADHRKRLLAWLRQRIDPALARRLDPEEVLNKAYLRAVQRWPDFPQSGLAPVAWLFRVVRDCLYDEYDLHTSQGRDFHKEELLPDSSSAQIDMGLASPVTPPSVAARRNEQLRRLEETLNLLAPDDRAVLRLLRLEGVSPAEAARRLGISERALRVRHCRALKRLKDLWKQRYGAEGLES